MIEKASSGRSRTKLGLCMAGGLSVGSGRAIDEDDDQFCTVLSKEV